MPLPIIYCLWAAALVLLASCVSPQTNLARLQTECSFAPLAEIGNSFIPVPGVGGVLNLSLKALCDHPEMIANDEAAVAMAIDALRTRRATPTPAKETK